MLVQLHPHTLARMRERDAIESEVLATVETGERFAAACGRTGFRRRFHTGRGRRRRVKDVVALAVPAVDGWLVVTVVVTTPPEARP